MTMPLLDSVAAVMGFMASMTWKGRRPQVALLTQVYQTGVRLSRQAMDAIEKQVQRLPSLRKWFVEIPRPMLADGIVNYA